ADKDAVTAEELRAHLAGRLPSYMVPASVTFLGAMPLTVNGKLDRRALPDPQLASAAAYVAPRTETEAALAAIWQDVLGLDTVGVNDNFFEIGGDSLALMRMLALMNRKLGMTVRPSAFVMDPTIASLTTSDERQGQDKLSSLSDEEFADLLMTFGKGDA
ncbi:phosphopantetheine-binding protein, partial [Neorhizobium sp. DT-125]|uniref:phosphopantetheine-binding protein n=1 Tax=Neorhizobium sp. DT-125 TaxID=3396163 RepID=UPI003F1A9444